MHVGVDLVEAWSHYWWLGLRREQGLRWIATVLGRAGDPPPELLLAHARVEGLRTADRPRQRSDLLTALGGFRARDDARGIADCLSRLAVYEAWRDEFAQAPALIDEAMRQAERAGHDPTTATVLVHSVVAADGFDAMARRARQAIPRLVNMGYLDPVTGVASPVGYVGLAERRYREARDWFEQGLLAARRLHDPMREAGLLTNLGLAELFLGETQAAQTSFVDALRLVRKRDPDAPFVPECLLGLAVLAGRVGDRNRSARLAATAEAQLRPGNATAEDVVWGRLCALLPEVASDRQGWDVGDHAGAALDPRAAIDTALAAN